MDADPAGEQNIFKGKNVSITAASYGGAKTIK